MSHRIHPCERGGIHIPTFWEEAAEALMELDDEGDLAQFDQEVERADFMLELQAV